MKTHQTIILLIGACLCFVCAIYPPRKFSGGQPQVRVVIGNGAAHLEFVLPNAFIFADDFGVYQHPPDGYYEVVVDGGLLLAELALIISLSGILVLIPTFLSQAKEAIYDANHSPEQPATVAFWSALRFTAGIGCCSPHYRLGALA